MTGNLDRKLRLPRIHFRVLLHAANMRHWTNGFTSLPKEGVLRIFFALKNLTASAGFEPANLGTKGQHATSRRPKPRTYITATCFGMNIARSVSTWSDMHGVSSLKKLKSKCARVPKHRVIKVRLRRGSKKWDFEIQLSGQLHVLTVILLYSLDKLFTWQRREIELQSCSLGVWN